MKDDDGLWVSLPSKNHPNEVYYFNVVTGVSTWEKPENFRESSDTLVSNASAPKISENSGYIVESLSPNSSPNRQTNQSVSIPTSENNEKKKGRLFPEENSFCVPKNRHFVRENPYRFESRRYLGSQDSKYKEGMEKNYTHHSFMKPPSHGQKIDCRFNSNVNIGQANRQVLYQSTKPVPLGETPSSISFPTTSSVPVIYGSASLRLEKLKTKLMEERLKGPKYQMSQTVGHRDQLEKETSSLFFKDKHGASYSGCRYQQHPYMPSTSGSKSESESSSKIINNKFKNSSIVPYRHDKDLYFSKSSIDFSRQENINKSFESTVDNSKRQGFTKDYFHSSDSEVNFNNKATLSHSTSKSSISLSGKQPGTVPLPLYLKKSNSNEYRGRDINLLLRNPLRDTSLKSLSLASYKHATDGELLKKEKCLPPNSGRSSFLRPVTPVSLLKSSVPKFENRYFQCSEGYQKSNSDEYNVDSVESRNSVVSSVQSRTLAADRLKMLQMQLQNKYISQDLICSKGTSDNFSKNRSWKGSDLPFTSRLNKHAETNNYNRLKCSENENRISMIKNKDLGEWNTQCIVHDYNHKRLNELSELPIISPNLSTNCSKLVSDTKDIIGSTNVPKLRRENYEHSLDSSESNVYEGRDWNGPKSTLETSNFPAANAKQTFESKTVLNRETKLVHSPVHNTSRVNHSQLVKENNTSEFVEPNQETLEKLHQRAAPKKKIHESKGGITKINRRVQKQIRTVAPKLGKTQILNIRTRSDISKDINSSHMMPPLSAEEEEMDWEPIEPEKVVFHVKELRKEGNFLSNSKSDLTDLCKLDIPISSKWFIVLDTNVLLSHLGFVEHLRDINDHEFGMPIIYIPWVVLQELDGLKSSNRNPSLKLYARKAVRFLQDNLELKHPRVRGQPKESSEKQMSHQPDDSILQCSLDLQKDSYKVLLLTNDRNLFNKAVVCGVDCCSAARLHEDLEIRRKSSPVVAGTSGINSVSGRELEEKINVIVCEIKECVGTVLEEVLKTEMILAYDRSWLSVVARKPPWTVNDIVFCIMKHWIAVFGLVLPQSACDIFHKMVALFQKSYRHSLSDAENLLNVCVSLISLLSPLSYKQQVDKALYTLQELKKSLEQLNSKDQNSLAVSQSSHKVCPSNNSSDRSTSDSDSHSTVSNSSSKGSVKQSRASKNVDSCSESGVHAGVNVNESDDDCISLVASSFCDNLLNKQLSEATIKEGQDTVHNHLNKIWEKVAVFCGMLSDLMGIERCVSYEPPNPFPSKEMLHQNMLFFVKCVSGLLRCVERILSYPAGELFENHPAILNFCSFIRDSFPTLSPQESKLLPRHVYVYCSQSNTRQQLETGKKQFEQFETVLNDAVNFFMKENLPGPSTTSLL